jgi:hypothetical protein
MPPVRKMREKTKPPMEKNTGVNAMMFRGIVFNRPFVGEQSGSEAKNNNRQ